MLSSLLSSQQTLLVFYLVHNYVLYLAICALPIDWYKLLGYADNE